MSAAKRDTSSARPPAQAAGPHFFDRELSWIEFNQRVLNEARDEEVPLLERLKFLAISSSNLDEFFRVRVGGLKMLVKRDETRVSPAGLTPRETLAAVTQRIRQMVDEQYRCFLEELQPALTDEGFRWLTPQNLNRTQQRVIRQIFEFEILSVLTPMAIEPGAPFPLLPNQNLNICVRLAPAPDSDSGPNEAAWRFAVIPLSPVIPRFLSVPVESGAAYLAVEDAVAMNIEQFFPGVQVEECQPFRLTRNAETEIQEDSPSGLAWEMEEVLQGRSEADGVRLEIPAETSEAMTSFLQERCELSDHDVYRVPGILDLGGLMDLALRPGFDTLKSEPWPPVASPVVPSDEMVLDVLAEQDVLLYHPYESFDPVVRMVEEAAEDPDVLAIKQTLYRVSRNSRIIKALLRAVENGKHVTALVELKARFDEARNLRQARELERAGAQVIWGVKGLKTHSKICIVVRRESQGIQRYVHFGTGNYNEATARIYSDASLMTSDEDLGADAIAFFNAISGYSQPPQKYRKIEAAPLRLRDTLLELIRAETERSKAGQPARVLAKMNALVDPALIEALYEASNAGVEVLLNVRGICCLKPGVPGLSENILVTSIVDRFLEHARVLLVHHGGDERVFISSADWMPRNLDNRKELLVPVEDPECRERLIQILETYFRDNVKASRLEPDGTYTHLEPGDDEPYRSQERLYRDVRSMLKREDRRRRTMFEPHRPE